MVMKVEGDQRVAGCRIDVDVKMLQDRWANSLERGLAVLQVFSREHPSVTLSEAASLTGLTRATALSAFVLSGSALGLLGSSGRAAGSAPRACAWGSDVRPARSRLGF